MKKIIACVLAFAALSTNQVVSADTTSACGDREGMSIANRIKSCGEQTKSFCNGNTVTLVARIKYDYEGGPVFEYWRQDQFRTDGKITPLIWGPEADSTEIEEIQKSHEFTGDYNRPDYHRAAHEYCNNRKDLGLNWSLPAYDEVPGEYSPMNKIDRTCADSFRKEIGMTVPGYWIGTSRDGSSLISLNGKNGSEYRVYCSSRNAVRCVARETDLAYPPRSRQW